MNSKLFLPAMFIVASFGVLHVSAQQTVSAEDSRAGSTTAAINRLAEGVARTQLLSINGFNCPVLASAERGGAGAVVQTRKGEMPSPSMELHLRFATTNHSNISEATIKLHGTDSRPRTELAYSSSTGSLTEEFHLTGSSDRALTGASVSPTRVVNVRWIGISELKFADGSTWHSSENSYCHIQPNGFQRVAATR